MSIQPDPMVTNVEPLQGPQAGGTLVTITGQCTCRGDLG